MYNTLNEYLKHRFGCKVYKLSLDIGSTCPNRDGTLGTRGCIFCNGAGHFAAKGNDITSQIEAAKALVSQKIKNGKYIAYFQSFTNTYAPREKLEPLFLEAIKHPDIVAISIATRPDCLADDILDMLSRLAKIKPVWVELGLQTIHKSTADYIRRGFELKVYDEAVSKLHSAGIEVITHMIIGLPFESREMMLETARYIGKSKAAGIKIHLLHILSDTDLAKEYEAGKIKILTLEEYVDIIAECIKLLPPQMVIHRLTGDGEKSCLIEPKWSLDKKRVLNTLTKALCNVVQGESL